MRGLLMSWWLRRQSNSNFRSALALPLPAKQVVAQRVEERLTEASMAAIAPPAIAHEIVRGILVEAVSDRHTALSAGAKSSTDPAWLSAALVEIWATARLAELQGTVKKAVVEEIEAKLQTFVSASRNPD